VVPEIRRVCVFCLANRHNFGALFGRDFVDPALRVASGCSEQHGTRTGRVPSSTKTPSVACSACSVSGWVGFRQARDAAIVAACPCLPDAPTWHRALE
jgi:hypothetical protein